MNPSSSRPDALVMYLHVSGLVRLVGNESMAVLTT